MIFGAVIPTRCPKRRLGLSGLCKNYDTNTCFNDRLNNFGRKQFYLLEYCCERNPQNVRLSNLLLISSQSSFLMSIRIIIIIIYVTCSHEKNSGNEKKCSPYNYFMVSSNAYLPQLQTRSLKTLLDQIIMRYKLLNRKSLP